MERLTTRKCGELLIKYKDGEYRSPCLGCESINKCYTKKVACGFYKALEKLEEYEDLEAQGKLPKLPCKVGDTYFEIETAFWRNEQECNGCRYYHAGSDVFRDDRCCTFEDHEENEGKYPSCTKIVEKRFKSVKEIVSCMEDGLVGETVFFTHEEAEATLKRENGMR